MTAVLCRLKRKDKGIMDWSQEMNLWVWPSYHGGSNSLVMCEYSQTE